MCELVSKYVESGSCCQKDFNEINEDLFDINLLPAENPPKKYLGTVLRYQLSMWPLWQLVRERTGDISKIIIANG